MDCRPWAGKAQMNSRGCQQVNEKLEGSCKGLIMCWICRLCEGTVHSHLDGRFPPRTWSRHTKAIDADAEGWTTLVCCWLLLESGMNNLSENSKKSWASWEYHDVTSYQTSKSKFKKSADCNHLGLQIQSLQNEHQLVASCCTTSSGESGFKERQCGSNTLRRIYWD